MPNFWTEIVIYIIYALPIFIIARKSEHSCAWMAFIPLLNLWLLLDMADMELAWLLLYLIPIVNILFFIYLWMRIAENTNKSMWWGVLMVVPIVNLFVGYYLALYEPA
jgi:uncharacterized membrane protein YhaH (DUF805 family)